jgi:hypothetical protein
MSVDLDELLLTSIHKDIQQIKNRLDKLEVDMLELKVKQEIKQ